MTTITTIPNGIGPVPGHGGAGKDAERYTRPHRSHP